VKRWLLDRLRCPVCRGELALADAVEERGEIRSGRLTCPRDSGDYPVIDGIPRFVSLDNYARTFGFQWNVFRRTQLDSHTGIPISRNRLLAFTGWSPEDFEGKTVLDVGCGTGRFAEAALAMGAAVVAVDYSSAVDACRRNLGGHPSLNIVQGDIYRLPFEPERFDLVYCLGVLQHTPDVRRAFLALPDQVRPGGRLAVDVYPKLLRNVLWSKYWVRPFTKKMPEDRLLRLVRSMVRYLLPVSVFVGRIPAVGRKLRYLIPVMNYEGDYPLSREQLVEWAVLDTFDMLSPQYDHPQSAKDLRSWFRSAGMENIEVFRQGFHVGRATKPVRGGSR
jgi:SAM-dependent methyltransferase